MQPELCAIELFRLCESDRDGVRQSHPDDGTGQHGLCEIRRRDKLRHRGRDEGVLISRLTISESAQARTDPLKPD